MLRTLCGHGSVNTHGPIVTLEIVSFEQSFSSTFFEIRDHFAVSVYVCATEMSDSEQDQQLLSHSVDKMQDASVVLSGHHVVRFVGWNL